MFNLKSRFKIAAVAFLALSAPAFAVLPTMKANISGNAATANSCTTADSANALANGVLTNAMVNSSAAIAYSKLNLTGAVLNADLAGSIAYSKLNLTGAVLNADLAGSIADTKLSTISTAGKVSNSATTATSANTVSAIVARDSSGNFTAGTATLTGANVNTGASGLVLKDPTDPTKTLVFDLSGISTGTQRTVTAPNASSTWAYTGGSQTLSSKSLTQTNFLVDSTDATKKVGWSLSGATTSTTTTLTFSQTANRNVRVPDADSYLVGATAATGSQGQVPVLDSTGAVTAYENFNNPRSRYEFFDDLWSYTSGLQMYWANQSGTSFSASDSTLAVPDGTTIGVMKTTLTASTAYNSPQYQSAHSAFLLAGGGELITEVRLAISNLSDATNTYTLRVGGGDTNNGNAPTNGIFFYYTHSNNSGKWSCVTSDNGSSTQVDSNITVAINTWYILRTVTNSAGTRTDCYVATGAGSAFVNIGNSTTNHPTAATRWFTAPWAAFKRSAGSGNTAVVWDYFYARKLVTR
jgi:hypothetical protein